MKGASKMPEEIIRKFIKEYGKRGRQIFYATAKAQNRDPETFRKRKIRKALKK